MAVTISQYIEAVANPNGRFRTLDGLFPSLGESGDPLMNVNDLCADFEIIFEGEKYMLKCLLDTNGKARKYLREIATFVRLIDTPFLAPCVYLENEILVFDLMGEPSYKDVLLTAVPAAKPLGYLLGEPLGKDKKKVARKLAENIYELTLWMWENEFSVGRISLHNISVRADNTPVITDYTNSRRRRSIDELRGWCSLVACLSCCSADPDLYHRFFKEYIAGKSKLIAMMGVLEKELEGNDDCPLKDLASLIISPLQNEVSYPEQLLAYARKLAGHQLDTATLHAITKVAGCTNTKEENRLDETSTKYLFIGEMNCNKMRAFDGRHWHYIDKNGEVLISGELIDASDFEEGRAVVETDSGYGIIDENGEFVLKPWFDDVNWDSYNNIIIATRDGMSGIFSRSGEKIAELEYDQILDCSEGLLPARQGGKFGYLRKDGSIAIDFVFEDAFGFQDGVARVKRKGRSALIDVEGREIDMIVG